MRRNIIRNWTAILGVLALTFVAKAAIDYNHLADLQAQIKGACPARWEGHLAQIQYQPGDSLWDGNLRDKAAFVKYAGTHLKDQDGSFLIDSFHDDGSVILNCGKLKTQFFELIKQDQWDVMNAFNLDTLLDTDNDGVNDALDICPNTSDTNVPSGQTYSVNAVGCTPWQADGDGDGVTDHIDQCPNTPNGSGVDSSNGCADSDGDGTADQDDPYPFQSDTMCLP